MGIIGLGVKLGVVPYYQWYVDILYSVGWDLFVVLAVIQKIHVLVLVSSGIYMFRGTSVLLGLLTIIMCSLHLAVEVVGGSKKSILALASVVDTGVLLVVLRKRVLMALVYFLFYGRLLLVVSLRLSINRGRSISSLAVVLSLLGLRGFPPFLGFYVKVNLLFLLVRST